MLYFVTTNKGKFEMIQGVLQQYGLDLHQKPSDLDEPDTSSLKEIALAKAKQAYEKLRQPLIVEDTGFYLEAYKGFPGENCKWVFNRIGYDGFFRLLEGKSKKAYFHSVICFIDGPDSHRFFEGKWHGNVTEKISKKKSAALPYARIFIDKGGKVPVVELPKKERLNKSQRGIAAHALGKWLKEQSLNDLVDSI
jgi:non-canonical purine NTP pyrophosphatase (RdgB/HAM1 family)